MNAHAGKRSAIPEDLAVRMIPTIERNARLLAGRLPRHVRIDDLAGAGRQGLVDAIARFDPARAEGFAHYAELRIRGAMLDELRANDPLSRDQRAHAKRIAAVTRALSTRLGHAPAAEEIAAELGISLETYWEWDAAAAARVTVSLDVDDEHDRGGQLCAPDVELADDALSRKELETALNQAIAALPPRLRSVFELHQVDGLTLKQIGDRLGVTESRVCQIHSEAVRRIRDACREHLDEPPPHAERTTTSASGRRRAAAPLAA